MKLVNIILAMSGSGIIGHGRKIPWNLTDDYKLNFVPKTKGCPVIMGRVTAETIFESLKKPLPGRTNIVISNNPGNCTGLREVGFIIVSNIYEALLVAEHSPGEIIWIIGGAQIYNLAYKHLHIHESHVTEILDNFPAENPSDEIRISGQVMKYFCRDKLISNKSYQKRDPNSETKDKGNSHDFFINVYR